MEAVKGLIFDHKQVEIDGQKAYKYLVCLVLITDERIENLNSETILMSESPLNLVTEAIQDMPKFELPPPLKTLGDVSQGILTVSKLELNDVKRVKPPPLKLRGKKIIRK